MALEDVLAGLPVRGEYLAQQAFDQRQAMGLASMLHQAQQMRLQQAQEQRIREMQPLQMEMLRAQIAASQQQTQQRQDLEARRQNAFGMLGSALEGMFPGTPAKAEMDAADNVMSHTPAKPDPRVGMYRAAAEIDPNSTAALVSSLYRTGGTGKGVDPMEVRRAEAHSRLLREADAAEAAGDHATAQQKRAYAKNIETAMEFEAGRGPRAEQEAARKASDLYDRTGVMPGQRPAAPQPTAPQQRPAQPAPAGGIPNVDPATQARRDDNRRAILERELATEQAAGNASNVAAIQQEIANLDRQQGRPAAPSAPTSPKAERDTAVANRKEANQNFVNKEFRPTQDSAGAARQMNGQIDAFRALPISKQTGWGTEAKAYAAKVLAAIPGMEQSKIAEYAASAEQFNSIMFRQNWSLLMDQKGVQTEGDAVRAQKVFAQLGNRPEANEFIWDFSKAVNDAAIRKAKFYSDNYPGAVRSGNVFELESQWAERNKDYSIFNEPSMKKWQAAGTAEKRVKRTGTLGGRRVVEYDDGTMEYR